MSTNKMRLSTQNVNVIIIMIMKFIYIFNKKNNITIFFFLHKLVFQFVKFKSELVHLRRRKYWGLTFFMRRVWRVILHGRVKVMSENIGIIMGPRKEKGIMIKRAYESMLFQKGEIWTKVILQLEQNSSF